MLIIYMILLLRGHIRNSFKTKDLYNLISLIYSKNSHIKIFIHTWDVFSNNISWRKINANDKPVTKDVILDYFDDLKHLIIDIIIENDNDVKLTGKIDGKISISKTPLLGWKYYWHGQYTIIKHINNKINDKNMIVINTRFDILNNSSSRNENTIINFIEQNKNSQFSHGNIFIKRGIGVDNIYIGKIDIMYKLIEHFHSNLDSIINKYPYIENPENLVYDENISLFNYKANNTSFEFRLLNKKTNQTKNKIFFMNII